VTAYRPLVLAHRGGADALPEHTLGAYLRALDEVAPTAWSAMSG
jgi:glycerophosphoryl diester phosphodiesterase